MEAYNSDHETYAKAISVQKGILALAGQDINRYNTGIDIVRTAECFESIPRQLSKTNKRFYYSEVGNGKNGSRRSADIHGSNLLWIKNAGYGNFVYSLHQIRSPLTGQSNPDVFRLYFSDTGLLSCMYGDSAVIAIHSSDYGYNLGAITENVVAECLMKCGINAFYYQNRNGKGRMEIDFVIESAGGTAAIEVKSGKDRDAPSLSKVGDYSRVDSRVMLENGNIGTDENGIIHMPLFASAFMDSFEKKPAFLL